MALNLFLQNIANGLAIGGVYAIFALGYTLVFSILGVINFAHAAVFTLGAYFTYAFMGLKFGFNGLLAQTQLPIALPFPVAAIVGGVFAGLVGVLVERFAFRPLRQRKADPLLSLVASLGMAVALVNIIQYLVGAEAYSYPTSVILKGLPLSVNFGTPQEPIIVRTVQLVIFAISMLIVIALTYLINATRIGKALRAVAEDETTASLLGINPDRLILFTFFLSGFLGGIAGTLIGLSVNITGPYFGITFGLKGLAVIILGGLGSVPGAVFGGLVIGLAEVLVPSEYVGYKEAVAFAILFMVLMLRPQGILGRATIQKV